jgi:hypothetical protein
MDVEDNNAAIRKYSLTFAFALVGVSVFLAISVIAIYSILSYVIGNIF